MREQFEELKNGCPWILIQIEGLAFCQAKHGKNECHYKGCAILYWVRYLKKAPPSDPDEFLPPFD